MKRAELHRHVREANAQALHAAFEAGFKAGLGAHDCTDAAPFDGDKEISKAWGEWIDNLNAACCDNDPSPTFGTDTPNPRGR